LQRVRLTFALLGLGIAGIAAPFAISAIGAASSSSATTTIKVTATEFKFALSKKSLSKPGTVIFKITNKGKIGHNFKIDGKKTAMIQPGKTATLKVVFKKKGKFAFLCTLPGHAANGMKGTFGIGVKVATTTTSGTTTGTTTGGGGSSCSSPTATVNVDMTEYKFTLTPSTVAAGCIQFVIRNLPTSAEPHNFDLQSVKAGAILSPGGTETWSVQLSAGTKNIVCDVPFHIDRGMVGTLTVT
jgi:uncharacterized cupredoxin-like copper-binding protein